MEFVLGKIQLDGMICEVGYDDEYGITSFFNRKTGILTMMYPITEANVRGNKLREVAYEIHKYYNREKTSTHLITSLDRQENKTLRELFRVINSIKYNKKHSKVQNLLDHKVYKIV